MNKKNFEEVLASVKHTGKIKRGGMKPVHVFVLTNSRINSRRLSYPNTLVSVFTS